MRGGCLLNPIPSSRGALNREGEGVLNPCLDSGVMPGLSNPDPVYDKYFSLRSCQLSSLWLELKESKLLITTCILLAFRCSIVQLQKISILPPQKVLCFAPPPPPPLGNSSLASYFASKILTFKSPLPLGFPMTFCGVGMDIFWNCTFKVRV